MKHLVLIACVLAACSEKIPYNRDKAPIIPPPMTLGKCTDWEYVGPEATSLICLLPAPAFVDGHAVTEDWYWRCSKARVRPMDGGYLEERPAYVCSRMGRTIDHPAGIVVLP